MCGIAGVVARGTNDAEAIRSRLRPMVAALAHRGPDSEGLSVAGSAGIGMRRLSIVDLAGGSQPIESESGAFSIVGNGEIYNAPELRLELLARGHRFHGGSDIETALHLFEDLGTRAFARLNGMFSLAILERDAARITVVRDRIGIKPLFYAETPSAILFSSELPSICAGMSPPEQSFLELDHGALRDFLCLGYIPSPQSIFSGIRRLSPGHFATIDSGGVRTDLWWRMPAPAPECRPIEYWCEETHALLAESVRSHTMGDVPAGALLSGGLDSGVLVALLAQNSRIAPSVFTIGFDDPGFDEVADAALVAERYGCPHHVEILAAPEIDEIDGIFRAFGEPFADTSLLPSHRVARLAARHVKFVLSGDGGDELFCGYAWLRREARFRSLPAPIQTGARWLAPLLVHGHRSARADLIGKMMRAAGDLASTPAASFLRRRSLCAPARVAALLHPRFQFRAGDESRSTVERHAQAWRGAALDLLVDLDRRFYLPDDILEKVDRATMMHSLEARVPYLDHRLIELAARIPTETQLGPGALGKQILRRIARPLLPTSHFCRRKRGFGVPADRWLRGHLVGPMKERLLGKEFRKRELLAEPEVAQLIAEHESARANHGHLLWGLLSLAVWADSISRAPAPQRSTGATTAPTPAFNFA